MKNETKLWSFLLREWDVSFGEMIVRTVLLALAVAGVILALRLMAWADTGSRGECPVEKSIIPAEFSRSK
jgi:hypothetical protein